jgi:hypothetical protein
LAGDLGRLAVLEQRHDPRYPSDWAARFRFDITNEWRPCRLIDVSLDGAAIELYGLSPHDSLDRRIHVEVASISGEGEAIHILGDVRHKACTQDGRVVVGIRFLLPNREQRNLLRLLVSLRVAD